MSDPSKLYVCWTTVSTREQGESVARVLVDQQIAACVQIDGPISSFYRWDGEVQNDQEFRLWIKCVGEALPDAEKLTREHHPYDTPQWVCVEADKVEEKYLKWAKDVSNLRGFL